MNFNLIPSLQHISLTKIAIQLWNEDDQLVPSIESLLWQEELCFYESNIFAKMKEKVKNLQLFPISFSHQLLNYIRPIALQIYDWYRYLNRQYKVVVRINPLDLYWTSHGTVDPVKTVQLLLQQNQNLEVKRRYKLARTFCLVEELQELLQNEIPEEHKLLALAYSNLVRANEQDLVVYFTQNVKNRFKYFGSLPNTFLSPYHEACHVAALSCNPVATKYFFKRLNSAEKNAIFSFLRGLFCLYLDRYSLYKSNYWISSPHQFFAELVRFLLSQTDENQRVQLLTMRAQEIFDSLLVWPYYRLLLLNPDHQLWTFFPESDFQRLLLEYYIHNQTYKIKGRQSREQYREMYLKLWRESPDRYRNYFVDHLTINHVYKYFKWEEVEVCRSVLSECKAARREGLFSEEGRHVCFASFVRRGSWDFLKFFVEECASSRETIVRFRSELATYIFVAEHRSAQFMQFLDNFYPDEN